MGESLPRSCSCSGWHAAWIWAAICAATRRTPALADEAICGFEPTDIVIDKAGMGALMKDAGPPYVIADTARRCCPLAGPAQRIAARHGFRPSAPAKSFGR
jgi:hypothetical protein